MSVPAISQMPAFARWESSVVKHEFGFRGIPNEGEFDDGVIAGIPTLRAPGLYLPLIGKHFQIAPRNVAAEERKRASHLAVDRRRFSAFRGDQGDCVA